MACSVQENLIRGACGMFDALKFYENNGNGDAPKELKWGANETRAYAQNASAVVLFKDRDYDTEPPELYKALEKKQWKQALKILNDDSIKLEQANSWVSRKSYGLGTDTGIRWRMTILHSAIIFGAPVDVVKKILELSPHSASCTDDQGMLPLHLSFKNNSSEEIMYELLMAYPVGTEVKDKKGRTPLMCGISNNPDSYRWKFLGSYTAMMRMKRRKDALSDSGSSDSANSLVDNKINRTKRLHEQEIRDICKEFEQEIAENNDKIQNLEEVICNYKETIERLQNEVKDERIQVASLLEEVTEANFEKSVAEKNALKAKQTIQELKMVKEELRSELDVKSAKLKEVAEKNKDLEAEIFEWRNSLFGGSMKTLFFCQ